MLNDLIELILINIDNNSDLTQLIIKNFNVNSDDSITKIKFSFLLGSKISIIICNKEE